MTFAVSTALVLLGLLALVQIGRGAANLSIDFTGGTSVQLRFDQPIHPDHQVTVETTTEIGPTIVDKLRQDALIAIAISLAGIILYISARFEFRFGIAAARDQSHRRAGAGTPRTVWRGSALRLRSGLTMGG